MTLRDDETLAIAARVTDELERLLDVYFPGWLKVGRKGYLAPKSRGDLGSFVVELTGPKRGNWYRHSQGLGGGAIGLVAYCLTGQPKADAATFDELRSFLGLDRSRRPDPLEAERRRREAQARSLAHARDAAATRARETNRAKDIWRGARPAAGTLVETWLRTRACLPAGGVPPSLRLFPDLPYWAPVGPGRPVIVHRGPAMVGCIQHGETRRLIGAHVTWLSADGAAKAEIRLPDGTAMKARKIRGTFQGGHVRLCPVPEDGRLTVAEGIETALSVMRATAQPVWAALSIGNLGAELPLEVLSVCLAVDMDEAARQATETGRRRRDPERLVQDAAALHHGRGRPVSIVRPPAGMDFNDWIRSLSFDDASPEGAP